MASEQEREYHRRYRAANPARIAAIHAKYREANRADIIEMANNALGRGAPNPGSPGRPQLVGIETPTGEEHATWKL